MTRCLIRKDFFHDAKFQITLKNPDDIEAAESSAVERKSLIEFCLPFSELKSIVEGMVDEENEIQIEYPCGDNMLQMVIPEESKGMADKLSLSTKIQLETYEATHTLDADFAFKNIGIAAQIFGQVHQFKKALKEFSFLDNREQIQMIFSENYPKLSFVFKKPSHQRFHSVKFNDNIEDFVVKHITERTVLFTIDSLRLAFSRITQDSLICIVTLNQEGALSVKLMDQNKLFMTESIILSQEEDGQYD